MSHPAVHTLGSLIESHTTNVASSSSSSLPQQHPSQFHSANINALPHYSSSDNSRITTTSGTLSSPSVSSGTLVMPNNTSSSTTTASNAPTTSVVTVFAPMEASQIRMKLRAQRKKKHVTFTKDVEDNEHKQMKTSKKCCIFHRKKAYYESDTESDSSDDEDNEDKAPCPECGK
ncbi:hypothetical protein FDP41_012309 [Naegleria fowleri]|uniref:Protein phosphatase inhibitor n=1 Tax=Naegleria fowleri TaxID=5763 RepID=A0A6A5C4F5_NAEFO|nr:uncharacterized protein FDP41_012309 [Naegleria fowleri]KAF0981652.1 hypothetical protein FDP41_012309 [Naegleria fowleri]CAG4713945.1 unnamed protein product [Naegleria fowleri]